jgi:hypothetical protein
MDNQKTQFLYLHRYLYGGGTTFTAHLIYTLKKQNEIVISRIRESKRSQQNLRDFGYGLVYQNVTSDFLKGIRYPFITLFTPGYSHILPKFNQLTNNFDDIKLVIHDPTNIPRKVVPHVKKWKIITIRKAVQHYLENKFGLQPLFLYHPFYPYPVTKQDITRSSTISISRIAFEKNIEIILRANKFLNNDQAIKIYGARRRRHYILRRQNLDFYRQYYGQFEKSFHKLSDILSRAKFVVDLSVLKNDGGGTQYTFLEAVHNGCAIIVHRKWLEDVDPKYSDLREDHNCFAVGNEKELAELIKSDPDTTKIVNNAKKLMRRHIEVDWSNLFHNID